MFPARNFKLVAGQATDRVILTAEFTSLTGELEEVRTDRLATESCERTDFNDWAFSDMTCSASDSGHHISNAWQLTSNHSSSESDYCEFSWSIRAIAKGDDCVAIVCCPFVGQNALWSDSDIYMLDSELVSTSTSSLSTAAGTRTPSGTFVSLTGVSRGQNGRCGIIVFKIGDWELSASSFTVIGKK